MKIYVASSWRNTIYPTVVDDLVRAGFDVFYFRNPAPGGVSLVRHRRGLEKLDGESIP